MWNSRPRLFSRRRGRLWYILINPGTNRDFRRGLMLLMKRDTSC